MDSFNVVPNKIHVLSTSDTKEVKIEGFKYSFYPAIDKVLNNPEIMENVEEYQKEILSMFDETVNISNSLLEGMDGS